MRRLLSLHGTLAVVALWTAVATLFAAHNYASGIADGRPISLQQAIWWSAAEWYTWALLTPLVVLIVRRVRSAGYTPVIAVLTACIAGVAVAALQVIVEYAGDRAATMLSGDPTLSVRVWLSDGALVGPLDLAYIVPRKIGFSIATFWAIAVLVSAVDYYRLYRERELRAARLETALASAQLQALQAQLQPHFLFNTLNAIASLIPDDPAAAEEMVEALSELLRAALWEASHFEIPLQRELELLDQYVRIQTSRFQHRLRVCLDVDPGLESALVPPLLLQPLVENAIRYAIAPRERGGALSIRITERDGALRMRIEDDGPGFAHDAPTDERAGIGLANTRERIGRLYGAAAHLDTTNSPAGGGVVDVLLPLRRGGLTPIALTAQGV